MVTCASGGHAGDRAARVEALFQAHAPRVFSFAVGRGVRPADAEDIVAATFLVCWRRILEVPEPALPWLLAVAHRVVADHFRATDRRHALALKLGAVPPGPADSLDPCMDGPALLAFQHLKMREQEILRLVVLDELSYEAAARVLGCSHQSIHARLGRAKRKLSKLVDARREEEKHHERQPPL